MKTAKLLPLILSMLIAASSSFAQDTSPDVPEHPRQRQGGGPGQGQGAHKGGGESRLLQHLLEMDDAQLTSIRQTIERIEKMSPEEKQKMRERIGKMHDMPSGNVEAMRQKFKKIPQEQREAMRERWIEMTPEERAQWRDKLRSLSPEERKAVFEEQGFRAPHPKRDKKGPNSKRPDSKGPKPQRGPKPDPTEEIEEN